MLQSRSKIAPQSHFGSAFNLGTAPVLVLLAAVVRRILVRRRYRLLNAHLSAHKEEQAE